jgi:putative DNA primase/helicase
MSAMLVAQPREAALRLVWTTSPSVPVRPRPEPRINGAPHDLAAALVHGELVAILDAIPNEGDNTLGYDEWRNVVFAIHHETMGSQAGLNLAHSFSARAIEKYNPAFLDERVWPYVASEGRGSVIGIGTLKRIAGAYGWHEPLDESAFDVVEDERPPLPPALADAGVDLTGQAATNATLTASMGLSAQLTQATSANVPPKRKGIPEAHHLTTDQANANRLVNAFGRQVFVAAGRWHVWDGKRWAADEADVYRYGCRLSDLIRDEARKIRARAALLTDPAAIKEAVGVADALAKWAVKSEMKPTIENAIGLARKMLTVDEGTLDRDPWALNVANGVVDLRSGELRPHNPDLLMTKLVPVRYLPHAQCPTWIRVLRQICNGDDELLGYLQRFAGYCLTGLTVEQVFLVLWGIGSNGKSTFLELMAQTMGDYAGTAAPNLLVSSKGDRHPTEIASLMGKRMVVAHESGEGVVLREDFVKQATGSDTLTARWMRGDFFQFVPTHKLMLVTNHKPQVKGQDEGIWRRVQLAAFLATFGTEAEVLAGTHTHIRDVTVATALQAELEGVLAWRVAGAVEWAARGLDAPAVVKVASAGYRAEQDRTRQFVSECCELDVAAMEPLTDVMGGLYPAYVSWCKEGGIYALGKQRFADEMLRITGAAKTVSRSSSVKDGKRRSVICVPGVRLLQE